MMIFHVYRTNWIIDVFNTVMDQVRVYHGNGELYYDLLNKVYFSEEKISDMEIAEELVLERSTFYRRKKEAILLCGILLLEEVRMRKFA